MVQGITPEVHIATRLLPDAERETVERAIVNYAAPKGFCDAIGSVIYRIWNAIKSIFGCSDWQLAQDALKKGLGDRVVSLVQIERYQEVIHANLDGFRRLIEQVVDALFENIPALIEKYAPRGQVSPVDAAEVRTVLEPLVRGSVAEAFDAFQREIENLIATGIIELEFDFNPEELREIADILLDSPVADMMLEGMLMVQDAGSIRDLQTQFPRFAEKHTRAINEWAGADGSKLARKVQNTALVRSMTAKFAEFAANPRAPSAQSALRLQAATVAIDQAVSRHVQGQIAAFEVQAAAFRQRFGLGQQGAETSRPAAPVWTDGTPYTEDAGAY